MTLKGYLWIKGRTGEFVKIRGVRVSLAEVEAKVAAIPGVHECAAAGVQHPEAGEALALFVVGDNGTQALVESVRHALPPHWTCNSVKVVADLPKTPNGKIARSQLHSLV
jgi:acyl-coenzyme A synthetase/AMP-(fatty) acid ligase